MTKFRLEHDRKMFTTTNDKKMHKNISAHDLLRQYAVTHSLENKDAKQLKNITLHPIFYF